MKIFKFLLLNILIIFLLIFSIEIIFGYWFDKDNLGPYMREHRMKKNTYTLNMRKIFINICIKEIIMDLEEMTLNLKKLKQS